MLNWKHCLDPFPGRKTREMPAPSHKKKNDRRVKEIVDTAKKLETKPTEQKSSGRASQNKPKAPRPSRNQIRPVRSPNVGDVIRTNSNAYVRAIVDPFNEPPARLPDTAPSKTSVTRIEFNKKITPVIEASTGDLCAGVIFYPDIKENIAQLSSMTAGVAAWGGAVPVPNYTAFNSSLGQYRVTAGGICMYSTGPNLSRGSLYRGAIMPPNVTSSTTAVWQEGDLDSYPDEVLATTNEDDESKFSLTWTPMDVAPAFTTGSSDWCSGSTFRPPAAGSVYDNQLVAFTRLPAAGGTTSETYFLKVVLNIEFIALPQTTNMFPTAAVLGGPTSIAESMYALRSSAFMNGTAPPPLTWHSIWKKFKRNLGATLQITAAGITASAGAALMVGDAKLQRYEKHLIASAFGKEHMSPLFVTWRKMTHLRIGNDEKEASLPLLDDIDCMTLIEYANWIADPEHCSTIEDVPRGTIRIVQRPR